jgi:hypothetical protein
MNRKLFNKIITVLLAGLVSIVGSAPAQIAKTSADLPPIELKLDHDALGKAPTVKVQIGSKTLPFLFDTGGGVTIITPDVARKIGCAPFGQITGYNAGGTRIDMKRCDGVEMKIGDFTVRLDVGVLEVMPFFSPDTTQIGGFVTLQTFANHTITIDLTGNRLIVETEKSLIERIKDMKPLESRLVTGQSGAERIVFVAANSLRGKIWMNFDTGNFGALQFAPHAQEMLGINFDAPNRAKMTKPVKLDLNGLGTIEMPGRERQMIIDAMLNYETISKMTVTIDIRTGKMWAKMNPQNSTPVPQK